jgi:protein involved in polysaccharide export with SLBB domain
MVSPDNQTPSMVVPSGAPMAAAAPTTSFPTEFNGGGMMSGVPSEGLIRLPPVVQPIPRELCKSVLPAYRIEPPDVLDIEAVHLVPHSPYHLRAFDLLSIQAQGTLPDAPIMGVYRIEPGGFVRLGFGYGGVNVGGMTVSEAEQAVEKYLRGQLKEPAVSLSLADIAAKQQISGQHLVGPDGAVNLGSYGSVKVVGMTLPEARQAIEDHLSGYVDNPEVAVDVYFYNSKVYYVITQGAGLGDGVFRFAITGNDTVLDAISQINGLQQVSSKKIWVARPTDDPRVMRVLPVNWEEITAQGLAGTNYQLFPGDRIFIAEDKFIAFDTALAKIVTPIERLMGFSILGAGVATRLSGPVLHGGGNPNATF